MSAMGKPVPDDEFKDILLLNMPESWTTFTTSYMAGQIAGKGVETTTVKELTAVLVDEYKQRQGTPQEQTLFTKKGGTKQKEPMKSSCSICGRDNHTTDKCHHKGKSKCGYCHKVGHAKDDCWKKNGNPAK